VRVTSSTEPGTYYLFDSEKHQLTPIDYARSGLEPEQMAPVRRIEYQARDGVTIHGLLTVPRGLEAKSLPAVLLPHGGPLAHDSLQFDWIAQFLANRGYVVLQPNFRGSSGYGIAFERAGDRQWGRSMQDDVTDGAQWLIQQGIADATRMAIVGGSYGGYAALMGAVKTPDLFRCAVSLNGVSDLVALLTSDTGGFKDELIARHIGDPSADRDMLEAVSPIRQIDKIKVPVLLLHAKDDLRVDPDQSRRMLDALQKAGKPSKFVAIESGEHWLLNEAGRTQFLTALEEFLAANMEPLKTQ
jgi:dipeptidyl aminopeptidase/acylaminoacyl peptidase